jgi:N-acetylglucosaminyl-diphospho-decaprenol L-rhamnosyltransferase
MPEVDVIIVNYLSGPESIVTAARIAGPGTEVWLVDNSGEVLSDPPQHVHTLGDGHNAMYARASNVAYDSGTAPFVLLLNPDVVCEAAQLSVLCEALDADDSLWAVAPALESPGLRSHSYLRRLPTTQSLLAHLVPPLRAPFHRAYSRYLCRDLDPGTAALVEQPAAACLLVRRSAVGDTLFDEGYRLFFNDTDLSRRMVGAGWSCRYLASVRVPHVGGESIERERAISGTWVSDEYDRAALRYARANLRCGALFAAIVAARKVVRAARFRGLSRH